MFKRFMHSLKHKETIRIGDLIIAPNVFSRPPSIPWGILLFLISVVLLCSGGWFILIPLGILIPLVFLSIGTLYGGHIALHLSSIIAKLRIHGQLEILSTTPSGIIGTLWATTNAIYHSRRSLKQLKETAQRFYLIALVLISIYISLNFLAGILNGVELSRMAKTITNAVPTLLFISALYIDLLQSIILGCIVGMLIPIFTRSQLDSNALSFLVYFTSQLVYYVTFSMLAFWLLPQLLDTQPTYLRAIIQFVMFFSIREFLIISLWHLLARKIGSDIPEMNTITGITS